LHDGLVPRFNTQPLADAFETLLEGTHKSLGDSFVRQSPHVLHFKQSAYNWLTFCDELPPSFDARGKPTPQTKFGTVCFATAEARDLALLFLNGKISFAYWAIMGDDFDVTRQGFARFPIDLEKLVQSEGKYLLPLVPTLRSAMTENTVFKKNAGKMVGSFNLARCRTVTDGADHRIASHLGIEPVWDDLELLYAQVVKTSFEEAS